MKSLEEELSKVSKKMVDYQCEISRLQKSLAAQKRKLAAVGKDSLATATEDAPKKVKVGKEGRVGKKSLHTYDEWALLSRKGFHPTLKDFVSTQLREDLETNDDIQVIDNPNSTTSGAGKKKHRKRDRDSDEESDDASLILARSQVQPRWCRHRISSEKSSLVGEEVIPTSSQQRRDTEESEGEPEDVDGLLRKRDQVEEELEQMKLKVEGMEWENRVRGYHETIQKCVGIFRKALINNFGNREESDHLKEVREDMVCCARKLAKNGFTLCICEDSIECVEKTVQASEIPEQKMDMTKTDDSVDNLVVGFVRDVTYVLTIPPVVK